MKVGQYIKSQCTIYPEIEGNPVYFYFQYKEEPFEIDFEENTYRFNGGHFVCIGSNYHHHHGGTIAGFETLEDPYEEIDEIPDNLIQ